MTKQYIPKALLLKIAEKTSSDCTETDYDGNILYYFAGNHVTVSPEGLSGEPLTEDGLLPDGTQFEAGDYETLENEAFLDAVEELARQYIEQTGYNYFKNEYEKPEEKRSVAPALETKLKHKYPRKNLTNFYGLTLKEFLDILELDPKNITFDDLEELLEGCEIEPLYEWDYYDDEEDEDE